MSVVLMKARNLNPPFSDWNTESRPISKSQKPRICAGLHNRYFMSQARRTRHFALKGKRVLPSSRASGKMPRSPRMAHKAPDMQARFSLKGLQLTQPRRKWDVELSTAISSINSRCFGNEPSLLPSGRYKTGPERAAGNRAYDGNGNENIRETIG